MRRTMQYLWSAISFLMVAGILTGPALAHEGRVFPGGSGKYLVFTGFRNEPAFEDEANALDFFVLFDIDGDGECTQPDCSDWVSVDVSQGDTVNIEVRVLYLEEDAFNANVITSTKLQGALEQDFSDPSRYNIYFKPNVDGAYGFRIKGDIQHQGAPLLHLDGNAGKFVCEGGSQDPEEAFNCVQDILQPFPLGANASYRNDAPLAPSHVAGTMKQTTGLHGLLRKRAHR